MITTPPRVDELPEDAHEGAWSVVSLLTALAHHGGFLGTGDLASRTGLGRDTARRVLRTLSLAGWVHRQDIDGREVWSIGPELPRIGIQFHELLAKRAAALRADFDQTNVPFDRS